MSKETTAAVTVASPSSGLSLFNRARTMLQEVGIDLGSIVDTYEYFLQQQKEDPELKIPTYRAKIPSGGGKAFDIITGDDDMDTSVPAFRAVVAHYHSCNALFAGNDAMDEPPICASNDGVMGLDSTTGEYRACMECPNNQWGSSVKGGRGKLCKNMRRLYLLIEGSDMPIVMTLPPTSIGGWEKYKSSVLGVQRRSPQDVVTEFTLSVQTNAQGIKYSVVQFKAVGVIGNETRMAVKALGKGEAYSKNVGAEDYNAPQSTGEYSDLGTDTELPY